MVSDGEPLSACILCCKRATGFAMTLTFDLLTSKSNKFIFVPNCTEVVNLVKFPQVVYEILC